MIRPRKQTESDAAALTRVQRGEVAALGVLFDRYHVDVRRVIARLGVPAGDVDDLVQATFLDVLAASARYDGREVARPWLLGLAVMHVRRHRRSLGRWAARLAAWAREPERGPRTPEEATDLAQRTARLQAALAELSEKKRDVLVLVTLEGLSGDEVAALLEIPVATVWTRLHHARRDLAAALATEVP